MEKNLTPGKVLAYLKNNWFQVTLFCILAMIVLQKDFSFQFNLNNPNDVETPIENIDKKDVSKFRSSKKETITSNIETKPVLKGSTTLFDRLDMGIFGNSIRNNSHSNDLSSISDESKLKYLKRFSHVALSEKKKYGIPASIILANGLLNSLSGKSELTRMTNNHFTIPCTMHWQGESVDYNDACYRHYENAWASYRDHSLYLTNGKFASLMVLGTQDYKGWARGLEELNYSNKRHFAKELINIIEQFELYRFDKE